jgi:hypothetical protein
MYFLSTPSANALHRPAPGRQCFAVKKIAQKWQFVEGAPKKQMLTQPTTFAPFLHLLAPFCPLSGPFAQKY